MGNNQSLNWRQEFELIDSTSPIRKAIHRQTKQRYEIMTVFPTSEQELDSILNRIKLRTCKSSPHLLPLHSFWKCSDFSACHSHPSIDLIFKTATPLEEYLTYRRVKNEQFTKEEIEYVIAKVSAALNDIKEMKEQYGAVNFSNVFVDGDIKLKDPFLIKDDATAKKTKKMQGFPSPQKIYTLFDTLSSFEQHTSDLFSLGILALQLIFPHQNLTTLYKNTHSKFLNCSIDINQLKTYINAVQDPILRNYVSVLTDQQPNKRREIHHLLARRQITNNNLKMLNQNPFEIIPQGKNNTHKYSVTHHQESNQASTLKIPTKLDLRDHQKPNQSIITPANPPPIIQTPNISFRTQSTLANHHYQPAPAETWRQTSTFQTNFRHFREDLSESTPINKINGAQIAPFRSIAFQSLPPISAAHSAVLQSQLPRQGMHFEKVSPQLIDTTYRTSFLTDSRPETLVMAENHQEQNIIGKDHHQANQQSHAQQSPVRQQPHLSNEQLPSEQVKTSRQVLDNPQTPEMEFTNNDAIENVIKFESIPTKIVESLNQLDKQPKGVGEKDGFVVEQYDIGTRYEGWKKNGMRNGHGEFIYKEGSKYKGEWKDNKMEGFGTLYYPNGAVAYEGQWLDDQFDGLGTVYNDTPTSIKGGFDYTNFNSLDEEWLKYEGSLKKDAKEGKGKLYLTNGEVYTGMFENDLVHGEGEFKRYNGSVIKGVWNQGLLKKIYQ